MTFDHHDPQNEGFFDEDEEADIAAREARQEDDLIGVYMSKVGSKISLVETIHGTWSYHLSETGENMKPALCGYKNVMVSGSTLDSWNMEPTHIRYKFCSTCHKLAIKNGFKLVEPKEKTLTFKSVA